MRAVDWLTLLVALVAGILIPVLVIVARSARRSGVIEQKLDDLASAEAGQDKRFADIFARIDKRLRWLEERIWGRDPRFPRGRDRSDDDELRGHPRDPRDPARARHHGSCLDDRTGCT